MRSLACTSMLPKYIRSFGGSILLYVSFLLVVNRCTIKQKDTSVRVNSGKKDDNSSLLSQINFFLAIQQPEQHATRKTSISSKNVQAIKCLFPYK